MGAGEEMELVNPAVAGTEVVLETTLESVTPKQTRAGTCVFVTTLNTFMSADGAVLNRNRRTVVLLDPWEVMMSTTFEVGDVLPRLEHTATPLQLFRYSAVTWNPHRHPLRRALRTRGGPRRRRAALLRAALALRCVTEGLGPEWQVANVAYRLRKPVYAPVDLAYTARVTAVETTA